MLLVSSGAILNIILNYIMVGRLGLGLIGTAQATLISEGVVSLLGLGYFFTRYAKLRIEWRHLVPDFPAMPNLLFTGLPSLIAQFNLGLLLLLHNSQLMVHGSVRIWPASPWPVTPRRCSSSSCRGWPSASSRWSVR